MERSRLKSALYFGCFGICHPRQDAQSHHAPIEPHLFNLDWIHAYHRFILHHLGLYANEIAVSTAC